MAAFYEWVRNIVIGLLVISLIYQLLADSDYKKYMRVCAGLVLILIIMTPVLKVFSADRPLSYFLDVEALKAELETMDYSETLLPAAQKRFDLVTENYKAQLAKDVMALFENDTVYLENVCIEIDENQESENFCRVLSVKGTAADKKTASKIKTSKEKITIDTIGDAQAAETQPLVPAEYAEDILKMRQRLADYLCTDIASVTIAMHRPEVNAGGEAFENQN